MMDKSAANGGPPSYTDTAAPSTSYTDAATPSSADTEAIVFGTSALSLDCSDTVEQSQDQELPRGVTLKEAHDPTSAYSYTKVALELPLISSTRRIAAPPAQSAPLPPFLLQCTLFASYDINAPHPVPFRQVGCPATHGRGQTSASSNKVAQSVSKLRKRLGVQIPLAYLGSAGFNPNSAASYSSVFAYLAHQQPRNGAEMTARSGNVSRYRKVSLFQAQAREMTGIVSRPLIERVLSAMYAGQGIYNKMALFPAEAVLRYSSKSLDADADAEEGEQKSGWLSKLKSKAKGKGKSSDSTDSLSGSHAIEQVKSVESVRRTSTRDDSANVRFVKTGMVFATLDLLAPPPRLLETGGPYPIEMNKASDADMSTSFRLINEFDRATDEDRFQKFMFAPTAADDQLFADMLRALERRGGIWVEAGRLITPSSRNPNPRERARFLVKGLFPERFVYRCKYYRSRKFESMPSDLDLKEVKKFGAPLVVHIVQERTGNEGIDLQDYVSTRASTASTTAAVGEDGEARLDWEWDEEDNLTFDHPSATNRTPDDNAAPPPDYTDAQKEMLNGYGIESPRAQALIEAEQDFFKGWSVGYTEEPFRNGNWMESIGTGSALWFAASGM
ncbi:hypothetical protein PSEUBRA_006023 [Kalmanozyma brasiliensis GHG001]|uniref:uncharacterized protein n=1 Tax=Kalmanozyma brasiliensis (strain GHG001) TaxID=1365824 RepID=UPI001CEA44B7|nr:uncharacterized protein PSEUBRA_006023 [Kalmanozyma brasiliensis GHG001]KAF6767598.1 hypothetical protein PSEUBRA_006023 [Kalmanozyma brasiliensis GHG001]